jgi:hypothetical protein
MISGIRPLFEIRVRLDHISAHGNSAMRESFDELGLVR